MAAFWSMYSQWIMIFAYLIANEIVAHNPNIVSNSLISLIWSAAKAAVLGQPVPKLPQ